MIEVYQRIEANAVAGMDDAEKWRARIAVGTAFGLAPWGLFFAIAFFAIGQAGSGASLLLAAIAVGLGPWLIPRVGLRPTGLVMAAGLTQSLLVSAAYTRGLEAGSIPWMTIAVFMAALFSGRAAGFAWTALCIALLCIGGVLESQGMIPIGSGISDDVALLLNVAAHAGLMTVSVVLAIAALYAVDSRQAALADAVARAEQASVAKSTFLARMSHELRTPLNAILGYSEMLHEDASGQEADDLGRITSSGRRLLDLVDDILDLSKVEAGELELHVEPIDGATLCTLVAEELKPVFNVPLEVEVDTVSCQGDPKRLRQCLVNLLANAARFAEGNPVTLRCRPDGDQAVFEVEDRGTGIPAETIATIFEPFAQVHSGDRGGTGLGLAIVKQLVHGMDGSIEVVSELGVGSAFRLRLPRGGVPRGRAR